MSKITLNGKLLFPKEYICAEDLQGRDVKLTIARLEVLELTIAGGHKETKPVLFFQEMESRPEGEQKRLVLNVTNGATIAGHHGSEANDWPGKTITLFPTTCQMKGETVSCIRIR